MTEPFSKLSADRDGTPVPYSHAPEFRRETMAGGTARVVAGIPAGDVRVFARLSECIAAPFFLLYVLHTPRGVGEPGRYQSTELDEGDLRAFLDRYAAFLSGDSRHDLWLYSPSVRATLVWDRHNMLYAYGPLDCFVAALRGLGFTEGNPAISFPHIHFYRAEFDADAAAMLAQFDWIRSPLRPEDEQ